MFTSCVQTVLHLQPHTLEVSFTTVQLLYQLCAGPACPIRPFLSNLAIFKEYLKVKYVKVSHVPSQFSAEQFGISVIQIGPQGKMLLQKYKGVSILLNTCMLSTTFYVTAIILRYTKNIYKIRNCKPHLLKASFLTNTLV